MTVSCPPDEDKQTKLVAQEVVIQEIPQVMQQYIQVIQQVPQMAQQVPQISQPQMTQQVITKVFQLLCGILSRKSLKSHQVTGCVPMDKRDPKRFYYENSPHNYSMQADLKKHVQRLCLSNNLEFFLPRR